MKSFQQFLSESINISGDFNGNLYMNGFKEESPKESFSADIVWEGKLYRLEIEGEMMNKNDLTERLQNEYPGAIVHQLYPSENNQNTLKIKSSNRYQPERLSWSE